MRRISILLAIVAALTIVAAPASAKKKSTFKTGTYSASGAIKFKFSVSKGQCYPASGKKLVKGFCVKANGYPAVRMLCPAGARQPDYDDTATLPANVSLPKSGKLSVTLETYSGGAVIGSTVFKLTLGKNGKGNGSVNKTQTSGTGDVCSTGALSYSAKK